MFKESVIGVIILQELGKHKWLDTREQTYIPEGIYIAHSRKIY